MNIDTLNAYCSRRLVCLLCLAQGRFNIHQAFACIGLLSRGYLEWPQNVGAALATACWLSGNLLFLGLRGKSERLSEVEPQFPSGPKQSSTW